MVKMVKGDVFQSGADIVAHGVNCKGAFGSGVAGIIAKKYPRARVRYLDKFNGDGWKLGDIQFVNVGSMIIVNCATQDDYGYTGKLNADYAAIRTCMEMVKVAAKAAGMTVACPKIGAGLAGGDWCTIKGILDEVFQDYDIAVYTLE